MSIISLPKSTSQEILATRRPWQENFFRRSSYSIPCSSHEYCSRIRQNLNHFRVNYYVIVMSSIFVGCFWRASLTVILLMVIFSVYLFRIRQLVVLNRVLVDDRIVLVTVVILTDVAVALTGATGAWLNVLVSNIVGVVLIVLHAGFRTWEDTFLNEEDQAISHLPETRAYQPLRTWSELFSHSSSYSFPASFGECTSRVKRNFNHFRVNYGIIYLLAPLVRYILHPIQFTIVFIVLVVLLYIDLFCENRLLAVVNPFVNNRFVILSLVLLTQLGVALTGSELDVLVPYAVVMGILVLHSAFRTPENLYLDEDEAVEGGLVSVVSRNAEASQTVTDTRI